MSISPPPTKRLPSVLYSFSNPDEVAVALGNFVKKAQDEALAKRDSFKVAVSGGSLPKVLGQGLFDKEGIEWDKWQIFFADERVVPLDHEDSNYKACCDALFSKVPIPPENIHPIDTSDLDNPAAIAEDYEQKIIETFARQETVAFPRFDLILLGMGPDGHTCSLFPGHALLSEELRWVAYLDDSPKPPPVRVTLTFPVLNHAHRIAFVVTGGGKKDILAQALDRPQEGLPSSRVSPKLPGQVYWFTDEPATQKTTYRKTDFKL